MGFQECVVHRNASRAQTWHQLCRHACRLACQQQRRVGCCLLASISRRCLRSSTATCWTHRTSLSSTPMEIANSTTQSSAPSLAASSFASAGQMATARRPIASSVPTCLQPCRHPCPQRCRHHRAHRPWHRMNLPGHHRLVHRHNRPAHVLRCRRRLELTTMAVDAGQHVEAQANAPPSVELLARAAGEAATPTLKHAPLALWAVCTAAASLPSLALRRRHNRAHRPSR